MAHGCRLPSRWLGVATAAIGLSTAVGVLSPLPAAALAVDPTVVELRLAPGAVQRGTFHVVNPEAEPRKVMVETEPISAGYASVSTEKWLTVQPAQFELAPGGTAEVVYEVRVPAEASGELAAMVVFEFGQSQGLQARFGMAVYVLVDGTERMDIRLGPARVLSGDAPAVALEVRNDGNAHCRPEGQVTLWQADGGMTAAGRLSVGMPVAPGGEEHFRVPLTGAAVSTGRYKITMQLRCGSSVLEPVPLQGTQLGAINAQGAWTTEP